MSNWVEPSRQNWIKDAPDSRVYGSRERMEARIDSVLREYFQLMAEVGA
jgi:hypothetical protein